MTRFAVFWAFDALIVALFVVLFFVALGEGSVTPVNLGPWVGTLAVPLAIVVGSAMLQRAGRHRLALALVLVLAIPGLMVALYFALLILTTARR